MLWKWCTYSPLIRIHIVRRQSLQKLPERRSRTEGCCGMTGSCWVRVAQKQLLLRRSMCSIGLSTVMMMIKNPQTMKLLTSSNENISEKKTIKTPMAKTSFEKSKPLQFRRFWVKLLVVISKEYIILLLTNCSFLTEAVLPTYHLRSENQCKMTGFVLSCFNLTNNATASLA